MNSQRTTRTAITSNGAVGPWLNGGRAACPAERRRVLSLVRSFTSPLLPDDYLELVNPLWSTRELRGRIERIERETPER